MLVRHHLRRAFREARGVAETRLRPLARRPTFSGELIPACSQNRGDHAATEAIALRGAVHRTFIWSVDTMNGAMGLCVCRDVSSAREVTTELARSVIIED